ncbi:hypothetical protein LTR56_007880 [Elasticomyces elasticus]|nr:hypothetical protein LTR56_007880 [Elasticomyces elasticus]KAK3667929.1 hypothetical protein LTR22_001374 [Elasticomyces elasticus]KAK4932078.1 hypothetical protein LTR49_001375 [Elasticomyces elasticus]KAK5745853.1 hypothetical protein LTS12_022960 [Elasticomyces elasticus]
MDNTAWEQIFRRRGDSSSMFDRYWCLDKYDNINMSVMKARLQALDGHKTGLPFSRQTLVDYMQRIDRGLLRYDLCETNDLLRFAAARHITIHGYTTNNSKAVTVRRNHAALVNQLQRADDHATFPLTRLPPELRVRVYELYLSESRIMLKAPTQPPLARTCRMLREEVLPTFYFRTTFVVTLQMHTGDARSDGTLLRFDFDSIAFLETMSPQHLSRVRKLHFNIMQATSTRQQRGILAEVVVSLAGDADQRTSIKSTTLPRGLLWKKWVIAGTEKVITRMESRDGRAILKIGDVYAFRSALEVVLH